MKQIRKIEMLIVAVALASVVSAAPVYAEQGSDDTITTESSSVIGSGDDSASTTKTTERSTTSTSGSSSESGRTRVRVPETVHRSGETEVKSGTHAIETEFEHRSSLEARAKSLLANDRKNGKEHTVAERQKYCKEHQTAITAKITKIGTKAQKHLDSFDATFIKVKAYQTKNQLPVSNYEELVATATAKQAAANAAVGALVSVSGKVDCSSADPATSVATVKAAADDAKAALQAYRSSVKAIVEALLAAQPASTTSKSTTEGTN
ncbi:MAG: hypothetical protein JWM37_692 [Candidatus Saccharibacteria bacterium]|nr:hypothetical protein [Candidatus Saccharibacteria bacterium]